MKTKKNEEVSVYLERDAIELRGNLTIPDLAKGLVIFAHGSGSSRLSPRNQFVAKVLVENQLATLLLDLLTPQEEVIDLQTREFRFDIPLLAQRLIGATEWARKNSETSHLSSGYFGSSTGSAAALIAAASEKEKIFAVVSRGGRPDLASRVLHQVTAPTLLIVGGNDYDVIEMNKGALDMLKVEKELQIVPGATHLFEETGTLEIVAGLASDWFMKHLNKIT
jgi:putative phosphoribosyl transferase